MPPLIILRARHTCMHKLPLRLCTRVYLMSTRGPLLSSYGLYSYALYIYALYSYGLYSYGLYSHGLNSYGLCNYDSAQGRYYRTWPAPPRRALGPRARAMPYATSRRWASRPRWPTAGDTIYGILVMACIVT